MNCICVRVHRPLTMAYTVNPQTKCWPDRDDPNSPCLRCQRLDLACERIAKKRGRKRKAEQTSEQDLLLNSGHEVSVAQSTTASNLGHISPNGHDIIVPNHTQQLSFRVPTSGSSQQQGIFDSNPSAPSGRNPFVHFSAEPIIQGSIPTRPSPTHGVTASQHALQQTLVPPPASVTGVPTLPVASTSQLPRQTHFTPPSLTSPGSSSGPAQTSEAPTDPDVGATSIFQGFTSKGHTLAEGLELVSAAAGHVSSMEKALANPFQDPITYGLLKENEANSLVNYYFSHLQDCICLLDPSLHTAAYMRQTSLILFTSVLAVAAKFTREKELYQRLLTMADNAIKTAIFQPLYELQVIQAICILVCTRASYS